MMMFLFIFFDQSIQHLEATTILLNHGLPVLCMSRVSKAALVYQLPVLHTASPTLDAEAEAKLLMKKLPLPIPFSSRQEQRSPR